MGWEARDNSIQALQLIHWAQTRNHLPTYLVISTDGEKASNHVDWGFLNAVLARLGLGPQMLRWLPALYASPSTQVKVNGCLSSVFPIRNGMRQGGPLSPLLSALVLEPLLRKIQANQNIRGATVGSSEHKLSAYMDDVLFHVVDPTVSLPNLMELLAAYRQVSNFKINYTKSEILPITIPPVLTTALKGAFPFTWASSSIRYLGIQLTSSLEALFTRNYTPLLKKLRLDLQSWVKTTFTWVGYTNIIKMTILPHILLLLQMVPIRLPRCFFMELSSLFIKFVWRNQKPRVAMTLLQRSKRHGGLGLPNILHYYQAIALQHLLDWKFHTSSKLWVSLEKTIAGRNLVYAPWVPMGDRCLSEWVSPLTTHSLTVWDRLNTSLDLTSPASPLAPVGGGVPLVHPWGAAVFPWILGKRRHI